MAKDKKAKLLSDASHEELLAELGKRLGAGAESAEEESEGQEFPTADEIDEMDTDALQEIAEKVGLDFEDKEDDDLKELLKLLRAIGEDEEVDADQKDLVKELATALGIKPTKKMSENIAAIKEFIAGDKGEEAEEESEEAADEEESDEEASDEEESEEESDEEEEEAPKKKKKKGDDEDEEESDEEESEEESDEEASDEEESDEEASDEEESDEEASDEEESEVDAAAVVKKKGKFPAEGDMKKRLDAFNKAAGKSAIDIKKAGGVKKAYAKLLERLVDADGNLAKWGTPYVKDNEGYCCGLSMKEVKFKGDKNEYGKCLVSGKVYSVDDEGAFVEKE